MSVCVSLCLCCPVHRHRSCDGLISRLRSPTDCVKETEKAAKAQ
jgi:hypothetical protein